MKHQPRKNTIFSSNGIHAVWIIILLFFPSLSNSQLPDITVRFANPDFNCATDDYCVDVQFKSSVSGAQIFGMNVRFFYNDAQLEFSHYTGFASGYAAVPPNPPSLATSPFAGPAWFNFDGAAEFFNGAIQLTNQNAPPVPLNPDTWTKVFRICFEVDNPVDRNNFCPQLVWDLEQNPANGGFLVGGDGVVITVVDPDPNLDSSPSNEHVMQYNWEYTGSGAAPYGQPVFNTCMSVNCAPVLACPDNITISCFDSTDPAQTGEPSITDICDSTPSLTYTDFIPGGDCGSAGSVRRTWISSNDCGFSDTCIQWITLIGCPRIVSNNNDNGLGSLRQTLACAAAGDTIIIAEELSGQTIEITTEKLILDKNLVIQCPFVPAPVITSSIPGLFEVSPGIEVFMDGLRIQSGVGTTDGIAFLNSGILTLKDVWITRNNSASAEASLIYNANSSQLTLHGQCRLEAE